MTTTERPTTTEPPAWLNLDGFCPPDVREKLTTAAGALEALLAYADPICREAYEAAEEYQRRRPSCEIDDCDMLLGHLTGWARFEEASERLERDGRVRRR